jgi:uncharacterized RmlC-like cupin family protein
MSRPVAPAAGTEGLVVVRPADAVPTRQGLPAFVGVSGATAGATGLCMNLVEIPPGAAAEPHLHLGFETAIYLLEGRVETRYGPGLRRRVVVEAGEFVFIAADVPHQPINLSPAHPARAIVARNTPHEQESVRPYPDPAG